MGAGKRRECGSVSHSRQMTDDDLCSSSLALSTLDLAATCHGFHLESMRLTGSCLWLLLRLIAL